MVFNLFGIPELIQSLKSKGGIVIRNKYGNKKTVVDDITFDSKVESEYYRYLKREKELGKVLDFTLQPSFLLLGKYKTHYGKTHRKIEYKGDFRVIFPDGSEEIHDVKGKETEVFKIKRKLLEYSHPEINFYLIKKTPLGTWEKNR